MKGHGAAKMASFVKKVLTLLLSVLQLEPIYSFALTAQNEMRKKKRERERKNCETIVICFERQKLSG